MSSTYAWNEYSSHKTNEFEGTSIPVRIVLNKYEKDKDGQNTTVVVKGAQFELYQQLGEKPNPTTDRKIGGTYTTDKNGQIIVHDLLPNNFVYYFLEINPSYGYTYDSDGNIEKQHYFFNINGTEVDGEVIVNAYNQRLFDSLSIKKTIKNGDSSAVTDEQKNVKFEFIVHFDSNDEYTYTISGKNMGKIKNGDTIYLHHNETAVIDGLPVGSSYSVTEIPVAGYTVSGSSHQGTVDENGTTAHFINTLYEQTGSLTVTKEVAGDLAETDREFTFEIEFSDKGSYPFTIGDNFEGLTINGKATINLKHGEMAVFGNLPEGVAYTVIEKDANTDGYVARVDGYTGITITENITLPFINYKDSDPGETGRLIFEKQVTGNGADKNKEFLFTVTFSDNNTYKYTINNGEEKSHKSGEQIALKHGERVTFPNLPVGTTYKITEDDYLSDGYIATISETSGTITRENNHVIVFENHKHIENKLLVKKVVPNEVSFNNKNKKFTFTVTINGKSEQFSLGSGEEKTFDLPLNAVYTVKEDNYTEDGFILSSEQNIYMDSNGVRVHEIICTNTFIGTVLTEISGQKKWNLSADKNQKLPESITVYLMDGKEIVESKTVSAKDNWKYTFTAPKYRPDGKTPIHYTVDEKEILCYAKDIDGYDITNTYLLPIVFAPAKVQKIIKGDTPSNNSTFTFKLKAQNGAPMPEHSEKGEKQITISGAASKDFGKIKYTNPGTYVYTISEISGKESGYTYDKSIYTLTVVIENSGNKLAAKTVTYVKNDENKHSDKAVFTNTYKTPSTSSDERVEIYGEKIWNHGSNPKSKQPKAVVLHILANGQNTLSFQVDESTHWMYSFSLPKYDKQGKEITYTIDETDIKNYKKSIKGFDVTNTHKSAWPGGNIYGKSPSSGEFTKLSMWLWILVLSALAMRITIFFKPKKQTAN